MARNKLYPKQVWWFVASFIGLVMAIQIASWVGKRAFASGSNVADSEGRGGMPQRKLQLGRFPLAIVNYARVIAFRHTIDVGDSISVTYAEAFIAFGYMLAIFIWEFINSTFDVVAPRIGTDIALYQLPAFQVLCSTSTTGLREREPWPLASSLSLPYWEPRTTYFPVRLVHWYHG